jgi:hypothetical protein
MDARADEELLLASVEDPAAFEAFYLRYADALRLRASTGRDLARGRQPCAAPVALGDAVTRTRVRQGRE